MKSGLFVKNLLIIITILLALNMILFSMSNSTTSYAAKNVEYKIIDVKNKVLDVPQMEIFFNELGKEGWELIQVDPYFWIIIFKR
jgi:hypothetical protein